MMKVMSVKESLDAREKRDLFFAAASIMSVYIKYPNNRNPDNEFDLSNAAYQAVRAARVLRDQVRKESE